MPSRGPGEIAFRGLTEEDLSALKAVLRRNAPVFSERECRMAVSLMEEALARRDDEDPYLFTVVERDGVVLGFACYGTVPLTEGCFDLYWIALEPGAHGHGIGQALLRSCETEMRRQGGRLLIAETSGLADYARARRFYTATGFAQIACIPDFYKPGDDKCIYVKQLGG